MSDIWTPARDATLRRLSAQRWSVRDIAREMGLTHGQVSGRRHRLGLCGQVQLVVPKTQERSLVLSLHDGRRSAATIARLAGVSETFVRRLVETPREDASPRRTLPTLAGGCEVAPEAKSETVSHLPPSPTRVSPPAPAPGTRRGCCWPMWDNKQAPTHVYCDAPRAVRRGVVSVYCAAHHSRAFTPRSVA